MTRMNRFRLLPMQVVKRNGANMAVLVRREGLELGGVRGRAADDAGILGLQQRVRDRPRGQYLGGGGEGVVAAGGQADLVPLSGAGSPARLAGLPGAAGGWENWLDERERA